VADAVVCLLVAAVGRQRPVGVLVDVDAERLASTNREHSAVRILPPTAGFVAIPYYFVGRKNLPRAADDSE
jgi:hypothetical protein